MKQVNIFPAPRTMQSGGGALRLSGGVSAEAEAAPHLCTFVHALHHPGLTLGEGNLRLLLDRELPAEGYRIQATSEGVLVYAAERRGFLYAASTLAQLIDETLCMPSLTIEDAPYMPLRGVHSYLPPKDGIGEFCRILDALAHLRYNTLFLEIGAGVEYESHPEVNDAWRRFCREARDYPGGPQGLQASGHYWMDSTHVELAGGDVLSKAQLMEIVTYARGLGIEVIPEIQSLSHSYYLTLAHREIAELPFMPYPDSYCPSNEKSYALYFDLAKELHALMGFTKVSIGHDEIRILGQCPLCRQKSGAQLLAYELNRLHDFYAELGVQMYMWGEALQNYKRADGTRMGDPVHRQNRFGRFHDRPSSCAAIDMIPKDIVMLDWCYTHAYDSEKEFTDRGIRQIFGNFMGPTFEGWEERSRRGNVLGAEVSCWSVADENENGRNGRFFQFAFAAHMLWREDYTSAMRDTVMGLCNAKMPSLRAIVRGKALPRGGTERAFIPVKNPVGTIHASPLPRGEQGVSLPVGSVGAYGTSHALAELSLDRYADTITFLHGTDFSGKAPYERTFTWYFLNTAPRILAHYAITYEDGFVLSVPVEYGVQVGNLFGSFETYLPAGSVKTAEDEDGNTGGKTEGHHIPTQVVYVDPWIEAPAYFTDAHPMTLDGKSGMIYAWTYKNPRPDMKIRSVRLYPENEDRASLCCFGALV